MRKPIQISIPKPCHENWQEMTPTEKGRFCASCQKKVYDFTKATDIDIAAALKNDKNLCGRFNANQLERDLVVPKEKKSLWIAASFTALLGLTTTAVSAQEKAGTEQHEKVDYPPKSETDVLTESKRIVSGIVSDEGGVLPRVSIVNLSNNHSVQTDLEGRYKIEAVKGDTLVFQFLGYVQKNIVVTNDVVHNVQLDEQWLGNVTIGEVV